MELNVLNKIKSIEDLPTLPSVAMEIISLSQSPDVSLKQISETIHTDPPLATKVLRMANSAFYRRGNREIDTLHRAIILMGLNEIINIITSVSILSILPAKDVEGESIRTAFWEHCVATGLIAKHIDKKLGMRNKGKEFVGGLLHDIGKIIIDEYFHEAYIEAHHLSTKINCPLYEAEMKILGTSHMEIGHFLMTKWNLPPYLADINLCHHQPSKAKFKDITSLICIADLLAKSSIFPSDENKVTFILKDQESWHILKSKGYPMDQLDLERITFEIEDMGNEVKTYIAAVTEPENGDTKHG